MAPRQKAAMLSGISFFSVLAVASLFLIPSAHAQTASTDNLDVAISPQYPAPYQTITLTPSSSTFDMSSTALTVSVNGKPYYHGTGQAPINLQLGAPGTSTTIKVTAVNAGQTYNRTVTVQPASVALVVEPISTTHPFYAGASLVPSQGRVRLVAIPDLETASGKELDPSTLSYVWKLGDQILQADSGIGQSVLDATAPQRYRDADVSVTVTSPDGSLIAEADTTISPVDPVIQIYENDPLLGPLFDTALSGTYTMNDTEDTYRGIGYYFSGNPTLAWTVNGTESGTQPDITVRATGSGAGSAVLNFAATDSDTQQTANSTLAVNFGKSSSGLFGL